MILTPIPLVDPNGHAVSATFRLASMDDSPMIEALISASTRGLSAGDYSERQIEAALGTALGVDSQLIRDGTYFVAELADGGPLAACGGWSWRKTLFGADRGVRVPEPLDPSREGARIRAFFVHPGVGTARPWARAPPALRSGSRPARIPVGRIDGHPARRTALSGVRIHGAAADRAHAPGWKYDPLRADAEDSRDRPGRRRGGSVMTVTPWELLGKTRTPDGDELTFMRQNTEYLISANGRSLMSSRVYGSEMSLADLGCARARTLDAPSVLIGGLGMGFTLRATLDVLPPSATVVVSELLPAVVEWNRGPLGALTRYPMDDPRTVMDVNDIAVTLRTNPGRFDAILVDVDNGPAAFTSPSNARLYGASGLASFRAALAPDGVLAVWSAGDDPRFRQRLRDGGFTVRLERVRGRAAKRGPRHTVFLAQKQGV